MKDSVKQEAKKNDFLEKLRREKSGKIGAKKEEPEEENPRLRVDLFWLWSAFCFMNERRQVGPNGPQPITSEAILAYAQLSRRTEPEHLADLVRFIPALDRVILRDFYAKQNEEMEKMRKKQEHQQRLAAGSSGSKSIGR